ncbi:calcium uniporter protein [Tanacetum coccineum]
MAYRYRAMLQLRTLFDYVKFIESDIIKVDEDKRKIVKSLSDYMLYLLIMKPSMMSAVAGVGQIRFRDTCAEATRFFEDGKGGKQSKIRDITEGQWTRGLDMKHINACKGILNVSTEVPPVTVKGDRSKSLLFDGCILAKELMKIEKEKRLDKWLILSKVWVELLCYGASHSRENTQAAQVKQELNSLMASSSSLSTDVVNLFSMFVSK